MELNKEKADPEVTAALRRHKKVYGELTITLSKVFAQAAETAAWVQKAMVVVQELVVKVGNLGDIDEATHNAVDELKQELFIAAQDPEFTAELQTKWDAKIAEAQALADNARTESDAMTKRLESAQMKQTAQEFVQRSYVASQRSAL